MIIIKNACNIYFIHFFICNIYIYITYIFYNLVKKFELVIIIIEKLIILSFNKKGCVCVWCKVVTTSISCSFFKNSLKRQTRGNKI